MRKGNEKEAEDRNKILANLQKEYEKYVKKIDALIDMRVNGEITEEEFIAKKLALVKEKARLQELLRDADDRVNKCLIELKHYLILSKMPKESLKLTRWRKKGRY